MKIIIEFIVMGEWIYKSWGDLILVGNNELK